ncbi:hypothetical protein [Paludisphaera soli]|uniref:hypothetical protein n=1 Tax=Paludisphaera soli TaxID=2712865 RepID=UPI0013EDCC6D|nr:hypothetical protein [Paludisphaera soli]
MAASAEWTPRVGRKDGRACQVAVARYDPDAAGYDYLPNVACDSIQFREGAEPPAARFRYLTDDRYASAGWPIQFQTILTLAQSAAAGGEAPERAARYVVRPGERVVALAFVEEDERPWILFDGFARSPQLEVTPAGQAVGFDAVGVAVRLWDEPIHSIVLRDAFEADETSKVYNREVPLRARFNPDHREAGLSLVTGNCTADDYDFDPHGDGTDLFPAFVDPTFVREFDDPLRPTFWTLDKLARYLMGSRNLAGEFVANPDFEQVTKLLDGRRPKEGRDAYDPADSSTYDSSPIVLPELDATGLAWPEVLNSQLVHHGFAMAFRCEDGGDGRPSNVLELYRKDGSGPYAPKSVPFQRAGLSLDPNRTAVGSMSLSRDFGAAFNGVIVETAPTLWEVAVVLAPAFLIAATDATPAEVIRFRLANLAATPADREKYRLWVCEEVGGKIADRDGAGYRVGSTVDATPLDCFAIWAKDGDDPGSDERRRRRPGRATLVARDGAGNPRQATLSLSTDYAGAVNVLWDGTGTWQDVPFGSGWRLLKDRLGILIDCETPEEWKVGQKTGSGVVAGNPVKLVTRTAAPNAQNPTVFLRLTTVIEGDQRAAKPLPRRPSSPMKETRHRYVDSRDSFRNELVHASSPNYSRPETTGPVVKDGPAARYVRDDREKVAAYAAQVRQAGENPPVYGTIAIPWIARGYVVGDQIREVKGRDLSLQVNALKEQGEAPRYPYVVGVDWNFAGGQSTTLHLSDRIQPPREPGAQ